MRYLPLPLISSTEILETLDVSVIYLKKKNITPGPLDEPGAMQYI